MGKIYSMTYYEGTRPDYLPATNSTPTFPPEYGFEAPRKRRESKLTEQEMEALRFDDESRDYCADKYLEYKMCVRQYLPFLGFCNSKAHAAHQCQIEDYFLRMKEYEREKRLRLREMKKKKEELAS